MEEALGDEAPAIARAGQEFALTQLTPDALSCYWYGALQRYGELYFNEETAAQQQARVVQEKKEGAQEEDNHKEKEKEYDYEINEEKDGAH